jgi:hypothetical protein
VAPFELLDPNGGPAPPGPWEARPAPAASFSAAAPEEQAPLWRISLPADPAAAEEELRAAEAALRRQEDAVAGAPARLRALVARGRAASFSTAAPPAPEARVLALMDETPRAASFSASWAADDGDLAAAQERFQAFIQQVQDAVGNFAVVETRRGQALIARTAVNWTGDMRSLVGAGLSAEEEGLHRRSVNLALRSRAALLRTFAAVMRGAAIVALMASSPLGAARALPAAWRFVDDLLREERTRRQAASPA